MSERRPVKDEVITLACASGCPQTWEHRWRGEDKVDKTCPYCGRINQYWFGEPAKLLVRPKFDVAWGPVGHCNHCDENKLPVRRCDGPYGPLGNLSHWCKACWEGERGDYYNV